MKKKLYGIIYRARNVMNNKVYIGQTIKTLRERKKEHIFSALYGIDTYFYSAIKKYGKENFKWKVIEKIYNKKQLDNKEKYWIRFYKSNNSEYGYNLTSGGKSGGHLNESTRNKIGSRHKGKIVSEETRTKMSLAQKGRIISEETRKKMSLSRIGTHRSPECCKNISEGKKAKHLVNSPERRKQISEFNKGKHLSEETKKKISLANTGRKFPPEFGEKISKANKGRKLSKEQIEFLRKINTGKHHSEETKRKIGLKSSINNKGNKYRLGYITPEETKRKISKSNTGKKHKESFPGSFNLSAKNRWAKRRENNWKMSDETRKKHSEATKRYYENKRIEAKKRKNNEN
jgi:group I intron endonuclease